jgi:hypothetical protein
MEARRNIARTLVSFIFRARSNGERLATLIPVFWSYRRDIAMGNFFKLAKLLAVLILPVPLADWLRERPHFGQQLRSAVR